MSCPGCGSYPLDLTVLGTESGLQPHVSGTRCSGFCSWRSEPVSAGAGGDHPCASCYASEITQGVLHCGACRSEFPIIEGVPRFNPDVREDYPGFFHAWRNHFRHRKAEDPESFKLLHAKTKNTFGFQWLRFDVTDHRENRENFFSRTGTTPGSLANQLFFDAGCGMGRYLKVIADEPGAEAVGMDLSLAVNRAYAENRHSPFIHVIQGDILSLPLRLATFDHVYSVGVLHHTPSTRQAFHSILKLAKPGGRVSVWVYHVWRPPSLHGLKAVHATLRGWISDALRQVTTRIPVRLLLYPCYVAAPLGWLQRKILGFPAPVRSLLSPLLLITCSNHPQWRVRVLDTFDWYSPIYQWKHSVAEVEEWFREAGLEEISTSGFPVSVRGTIPAGQPRCPAGSSDVLGQE